MSKEYLQLIYTCEDRMSLKDYGEILQGLSDEFENWLILNKYDPKEIRLFTKQLKNRGNEYIIKVLIAEHFRNILNMFLINFLETLEEILSKKTPKNFSKQRALNIKNICKYPVKFQYTEHDEDYYNIESFNL